MEVVGAGKAARKETARPPGRAAAFNAAPCGPADENASPNAPLHSRAATLARLRGLLVNCTFHTALAVKNLLRRRLEGGGCAFAAPGRVVLDAGSDAIETSRLALLVPRARSLLRPLIADYIGRRLTADPALPHPAGSEAAGLAIAAAIHPDRLDVLSFPIVANLARPAASSVALSAAEQEAYDEALLDLLADCLEPTAHATLPRPLSVVETLSRRLVTCGRAADSAGRAQRAVAGRLAVSRAMDVARPVPECHRGYRRFEVLMDIGSDKSAADMDVMRTRLATWGVSPTPGGFVHANRQSLAPLIPGGMAYYFGNKQADLLQIARPNAPPCTMAMMRQAWAEARRLVDAAASSSDRFPRFAVGITPDVARRAICYQGKSALKAAGLFRDGDFDGQAHGAANDWAERFRLTIVHETEGFRGAALTAMDLIAYAMRKRSVNLVTEEIEGDGDGSLREGVPYVVFLVHCV